MTTRDVGLRDLWSASDDYRQRFQPEHEVQSILDLLELRDGLTLADVGCGNGAFAIAAAARCPRCSVLAFDALSSAAAQCRSDAGDLLERNLKVGIGAIEAIPLPEASVDRVLCRSVLHHVARPAEAYAEIARILRPGGVLVLQTPCNYWDEDVGAFLSDMFMLMDDTHRRGYHQPAQIIQGLHKVGVGLKRAACWAFDFPYLDRRQASLVSARGLDGKLGLKQVNDETWGITLYWFRLVGVRQ